jgi:hypothetical protein
LARRHGATSSLLRVWANVETTAYAVCEASFVPLERMKTPAATEIADVGMDGDLPNTYAELAMLDGRRMNGILADALQGPRS